MGLYFLQNIWIQEFGVSRIQPSLCPLFCSYIHSLNMLHTHIHMFLHRHKVIVSVSKKVQHFSKHKGYGIEIFPIGFRNFKGPLCMFYDKLHKDQLNKNHMGDSFVKEQSLYKTIERKKIKCRCRNEYQFSFSDFFKY